MRTPGNERRSMNSFCKIFTGFAALSLVASPVASGAPTKEARVTQIIRDVKLLPSKDAPRPASVNDKVAEDTGVRTGGDSRSELTFPDLTITRLGANSIFSFNKAGHSTQLDTGSLLLRVPKNSGGGIRTSAVTVAVTGTTVILETARSGKSKLITLEGSARLSLVKYPRESRQLQPGQMLDVPAGATTLPMPVNVNVDQVMKSHPLITDFKPLPSRDLIAAVIQDQRNAPVEEEQSARGSGIPSWLPNIGISIGGGGGIVRHPSRDPRGPRGPQNPGGTTAGHPKGTSSPDPRGQTAPPSGGYSSPPPRTAIQPRPPLRAVRPKPTPTPPVIR